MAAAIRYRTGANSARFPLPRLQRNKMRSDPAGAPCSTKTTCPLSLHVPRSKAKTDRARERLTEDLDRGLKLKSAKPHRHPRIQRRGAANRRVFSPSGLKRNQPIQRLLTHVTISDFPSGFSHQRLYLSPYLGGLYPVK